MILKCSNLAEAISARWVFDNSCTKKIHANFHDKNNNKLIIEYKMSH